jgi:hypothetical protein
MLSILLGEESVVHGAILGQSVVSQSDILASVLELPLAAGTPFGISVFRELVLAFGTANTWYNTENSLECITMNMIFGCSNVRHEQRQLPPPSYPFSALGSCYYRRWGMASLQMTYPSPGRLGDRLLLKDHQLSRRLRARKACTHCRARKVRCDVKVHGWPCTVCREDSAECTVVARKKVMHRKKVISRSVRVKEVSSLYTHAD